MFAQLFRYFFDNGMNFLADFALADRAEILFDRSKLPSQYFNWQTPSQHN